MVVRKYVEVNKSAVALARFMFGKARFEKDDWNLILSKYAEWVERNVTDRYEGKVVRVVVDDDVWDRFVKAVEKVYGKGNCAIAKGIEGALAGVKHWYKAGDGND